MSSLPASDDVLERLSELAQRERSSLAALGRYEGLTPEDAVDCVQEALCTLLDLVQGGKVKEDADLAPVLRTIVRNAARNQRRRFFRARPHDEWTDEAHSDEATLLPESSLLRAEEAVRLRACVAELCAIQRGVVTLRMLEERPGEDVAEMLGITKGHAAVLLYRAKASLRACLLELA